MVQLFGISDKTKFEEYLYLYMYILYVIGKRSYSRYRGKF